MNTNQSDIPMTRELFVSACRALDSSIIKLLNDLDRQGQDDRTSSLTGGGNRRKQPRLPYRRAGGALELPRPEGGSSTMLVCTRNLSAGGLAYLHFGALELGTRCKLMLPRAHASAQLVEGVVVTCRAVAGPIHEIGIQFPQRIDLSAFFDVMPISPGTGT